MGGTRRRMLDAAAALIRERGYAASSLNDILEASDAPRGSLYHHFPGGKDELVLEATRQSVERLTAILESALAESGDPAAGLRAYLDGAAAELRASDYGLGCPVASVVLDNPTPGTPLAELCRDAFDTWTRTYATHLAAAGLTVERSETLATLIMSAVEGAILLARARRDTTPLDEVGAELTRSIETAVAAGS